MAKINEVKVGDIVKMANDRFAGYGYPKGTSVKIDYKSGGTLNVSPTEGTTATVSVTAADVQICPQTKEEIKSEIKRLEEAVSLRKDKLKWMEDTKTEVYDEDEFKVWQILSAMDSKCSKIVKARAIAAIVKK